MRRALNSRRGRVADRPVARAATEDRKPLQEPRDLRVLQVTANYFPFMGGVETHVYEVSRRMAAEGVDVTVLTSDRTGELPSSEEEGGVKIRRVRAWPRSRDYFFAPGVYREIVRGDWDIIHCQGYHNLVPPIAMLAAWRSKTPYVLTFHSGGHSSRLRNAMRGVQRALLRPLLARADKLVGVSRFEADSFRRSLRLPRDRFTVIQNGSNLPSLEAVAPGERNGATIILSVGRLERYKGHQRAISALPAILAERADARLRIVGAGPYESELRRLANRFGVAGRVEIGPIPPGDRVGMARAVWEASLVLLLSDYEANPVSVMEALGMERPVLVTYTSGLAELADRGLVRAIPLGSSDEQVATAILAELESPLQRAHVALPTWDKCTADLLALYRRILARANGS
jgi:glycosyltransferase involved in cell wall biosynthesis